MSDPRWGEVFSGRLPAELPSVPKVSTPLVRNPVCPTHCTGNHGVEATIGCPKCSLVVGQLVAHEWHTQEGHYFYTRESVPGYSAVIADCPRCHVPLERIASR